MSIRHFSLYVSLFVLFIGSSGFGKGIDAEKEFRSFITRLIVEHNNDLEMHLYKERSTQEHIKFSMWAYDTVVAVVSQLVQEKPKYFIKTYCAKLPEGTLKTAFKLLYAIQYEENIDEEYDYRAMVCPRWSKALLPICLPTKPDYCSLKWHLDFSNNPFCNEKMVPVFFPLLQPILDRIYPGNMDDFGASLYSINISNNKYDPSQWLYLLPDGITETTEKVGGTWGLGRVYLRKEHVIDTRLFNHAIVMRFQRRDVSVR